MYIYTIIKAGFSKKQRLFIFSFRNWDFFWKTNDVLPKTLFFFRKTLIYRQNTGFRPHKNSFFTGNFFDSKLDSQKKNWQYWQMTAVTWDFDQLLRSFPPRQSPEPEPWAGALS